MHFGNIEHSVPPVLNTPFFMLQTKLWLFPEGTRNKDFTSLLPFKKGAFNIAVAAQVPVIPVVFSPYYFINMKRYIFNKGII